MIIGFYKFRSLLTVETCKYEILRFLADYYYQIFRNELVFFYESYDSF